MINESTNKNFYDVAIRMAVLAFIIAWCLLILYPFVNILLWSFILAIALHPLHITLSKKIGGRPKLASFIIIFSILILVIFPTGLLINSLFGEVKGLKDSYENGTLSIPPANERIKELPLVGEKIYIFWQSASSNMETTLVKYQDQLVAVGKKLAGGILSAAGGVVQIFAALIIAGFILFIGGIGESIRKFFRKLAGIRGDEFADLTVKTIANVVKGIIGVAFILAMLHGIFFAIAGIPFFGIWTLIVFVLAVLQIPLFIVTLPVILYIFMTKDVMPAIVWTVVLLVIGLSDNVLKPILLGKGAPVPMLVIFIGVIGGFIFSGFIGLFTGAIIMSLGYKLLVGWMNDTPEKVQN